jgi:hypothetical protein
VGIEFPGANSIPKAIRTFFALGRSIFEELRAVRNALQRAADFVGDQCISRPWICAGALRDEATLDQMFLIAYGTRSPVRLCRNPAELRES